MNNKRNAGRPASIIELHLNNFDATIEKILGLNEKNRLRLLKLCSEIQYTLSSSSSIGTQTETKTYADISLFPYISLLYILISSIEDDSQREHVYKYWKTQKRDKEYDEASFFDDLLDNKINIA